MPYLQLDLEAKKMVPRVARAMSVPDAQIGWGLIELWDWCWNEKRDVVSGIMLHGFFGAIGAELGPTLEAFGFLEAHPEGYRVRGAEKYLRISEAQKEAGKKHSGNLKRGKKLPGLPGEDPEVEPETTPGSAPALTPNHPITHTPNKEKPPNPLSGTLVEKALSPKEQETMSATTRVMAHYVEAMRANGKEVRDTPKRRKLISARLNDGHPPAELLDAISGLTWSEYHMNKGYTDIEYAIRDAGQIDMMLAKLKMRGVG